MIDAPKPIQKAFERLKKQETGYLQLKEIDGRYYVHRSTSVWDKAEKKPKKISEHLGTITLDGEFKPKTPRTNVPVTDREIYEYSNSRLAYHLLQNVHDSLKNYTPYADELVSMAIIRAIDPQPLRMHPSRWEKLYISRDMNVTVNPKHLSSVLKSVGKEKTWWHDLFSGLMETDDLLLYDLTTVFSQSQNIKRAEKGYNRKKLYINQIGVILAFSTENNLPAGVDVFRGSVKDITTFKEFLELLKPDEVGFIVDRGLFSEPLIKDLRKEGLSYVMPLRKDSKYIDLRWLRWQDPFTYRKRTIRWARRHTDIGTLYLFDDPKLRGDQEEALLRKLKEGALTREKYEKKKERAGIIAIISDLNRPGPEIYDLYKGRQDVELAFDAMKNHLDADKTYLQSDEAVRGYFFVTFLALRIYFGILKKLREAEKTSEISVDEVFYELSKVERIVEPGGKEVYSHIPKKTREIIDLFPQALPMG